MRQEVDNTYQKIVQKKKSLVRQGIIDPRKYMVMPYKPDKPSWEEINGFNTLKTDSGAKGCEECGATIKKYRSWASNEVSESYKAGLCTRHLKKSMALK